MGFSIGRALTLTIAMSGFGCGGAQATVSQTSQNCRSVGSRGQVICGQPIGENSASSVYVTGGKNGGTYLIPTPPERAVIARQFMRFDNR